MNDSNLTLISKYENAVIEFNTNFNNILIEEFDKTIRLLEIIKNIIMEDCKND
jgi:hypothetical protein